MTWFNKYKLRPACCSHWMFGQVWPGLECVLKILSSFSSCPEKKETYFSMMLQNAFASLIL